MSGLVAISVSWLHKYPNDSICQNRLSPPTTGLKQSLFIAYGMRRDEPRGCGWFMLQYSLRNAMWLRSHHPGATLCKALALQFSLWRKHRYNHMLLIQSRVNTHHFSSHCIGFHSTSKGVKICREEVKQLVIIASAPWWGGPRLLGRDYKQ